MPQLIQAAPDAFADGSRSSPGQGWFESGERIGYDPETRAVVAARGAPLRVFVSREGEISHAVSFLPGFPDGSIGWAKVKAHLPRGAAVDEVMDVQGIAPEP